MNLYVYCSMVLLEYQRGKVAKTPVEMVKRRSLIIGWVSIPAQACALVDVDNFTSIDTTHDSNGPRRLLKYFKMTEPGFEPGTSPNHEGCSNH